MNRMNLLQLINDNAAKPRSWSLNAVGDEATLYIYDVIGGMFGGVDAEEVARELAASEASTIHVRINSPGGDVFDAVAIATALRQHPATVVSHIDGVAASAATSIAITGERVEIADGGMFMIHNAWTLALGNRHDMLDTASLLEKVDGNIQRAYAQRSGASAEQVTEWMDAETWFTADEALEAGFVDAVVSGESARARAWNLAAYANAPEISEPENAPPRPDVAALYRKLETFARCSA